MTTGSEPTPTAFSFFFEVSSKNVIFGGLKFFCLFNFRFLKGCKICVTLKHLFIKFLNETFKKNYTAIARDYHLHFYRSARGQFTQQN